MKETLESNLTGNVTKELPAPKGIGMAVAFDWGLTVELLLIPILSVFLGSPAFSKQTNMGSSFAVLTSFVIFLPIAALFGIFGEGIRRGWRWTRLSRRVFL